MAYRIALVAVLALCTAPLATLSLSTSHYIFSAECTHYMDWQSVGLYHSWKLAGSPGRITRLLSCTPEQLKSYRWLDLMPTHVHPPMNQHHPGDWYPPYNLPGSVLHWITNNDVHEDFVVKLDGDMVLRKPFTAEEMGARLGAPVGGYYGYLAGVDNGMSKYFLNPEQAAIAAKVGGWVVMATSDMRRVAPKWLEFTEKVREYGNPAWNMTGDAYVSIANPKPWISEMYGFVFGCASVGLKVKEDGDRMLYPGYTPWNAVSADPYVLHYGLTFTMGSAYRYDKHDWSHQDMLTCDGKTAGPLFPATPPIESLRGTPDYPKDKDEMVAYQLMEETIAVLNQALANHHREQGCLEPGAEPAAQSARLRGSNSNSNSNAAVGVTPVVHAEVHAEVKNERAEEAVRGATGGGRWRLYGTVRDGRAGDTVQVFKRARAGGVTVCAEVATGMHENTDFGKDPFYEAYIRPGEAPCQLADEDRLLFAVRSAAGVTRRTPDWLKATFMSNMEQQIAIETLAEENQQAPRIIESSGGSGLAGGSSGREGLVERQREQRQHTRAPYAEAGQGDLVLNFQGGARAVPGPVAVEARAYYYPRPHHPLLKIMGTGLMWGVFAMLLLAALGLPRGGAAGSVSLLGGLRSSLRRLTRRRGTKTSKSAL